MKSESTSALIFRDSRSRVKACWTNQLSARKADEGDRGRAKFGGDRGSRLIGLTLAGFQKSFFVDGPLRATGRPEDPHAAIAKPIAIPAATFPPRRIPRVTLSPYGLGCRQSDPCGSAWPMQWVRLTLIHDRCSGRAGVMIVATGRRGFPSPSPSTWHRAEPCRSTTSQRLRRPLRPNDPPGVPRPDTHLPPPSARGRPRPVRGPLQHPSAAPLSQPDIPAHDLPGAAADLFSKCGSNAKIRPTRWPDPRVQTRCLRQPDGILGTHRFSIRKVASMVGAEGRISEESSRRDWYPNPTQSLVESLLAHQPRIDSPILGRDNCFPTFVPATAVRTRIGRGGASR